RSVYIREADIWTEPQNLGLPINSAGDDDHFRLARDGFTGFFDSSRKDGLGQRDLYVAYFNDYLNEMEPPAAQYTSAEPESIPQPPVQPPKQEPKPPIVANTNIEADNVLFLNSESDLNNVENTRFLSQIANQLNTDPDKKLVITTFALNSKNTSTALSQAIARAERAAAMLTRQGVSENAIFMRGAIAESAPSGQNASFGMDFKINEQESLIDKGVSTEDFDAILQQDLVYKVQIASSKNSNYNNALLLQYAHPMVEKTLDFEYYRYTVGAVNSFAEAEQLRRELVGKGITGAFIAPYIYGRRVDAKSAKPYVQTFPDLRNYVR
ncbi:MAG: hypothetical protein SFU99_23510, partial [Saprospiraceae bacterium]|nr:hypothetical protein [Saprospiraceae bacterium]